jgi:hypothetical protein
MPSGWLRLFMADGDWLRLIRAEVGRPRRHRCHQRPLAGWLIVAGCQGFIAELSRSYIKSGACGAAGPASAPRAQPLGGSARAHAGPLTIGQPIK